MKSPCIQMSQHLFPTANCTLVDDELLFLTKKKTTTCYRVNSSFEIQYSYYLHNWLLINVSKSVFCPCKLASDSTTIDIFSATDHGKLILGRFQSMYLGILMYFLRGYCMSKLDSGLFGISKKIPIFCSSSLCIHNIKLSIYKEEHEWYVFHILRPIIIIIHVACVCVCACGWYGVLNLWRTLSQIVTCLQ
jgi:hypothetical protein